MRLLITGVRGQLGHDILQEAKNQSIDVVGVDVAEMDITNKEKVNDYINKGNFDAVIHCAAWTAVDKAEEMIQECRQVNALGTKYIADTCAVLDIPLMYFSTDYVFNGENEEPWNEYDERKPLNVYGLTKYEGEKIVESLKKYFIIRISWVFGKNGNNFIKTMLRLGTENGSVNVVDDQIGSPTYTYDLAKLAVVMIKSNKFGAYHATNEGMCSWYEFACEIFKQANLKVNVTPVSSDLFKTAAVRPKNSCMNKTELDKNGFHRLPSWQDAVKRYLTEIRKNNIR